MKKIGLMLGLASMMAEMSSYHVYGKNTSTNDGSIGHGIPDNPKKVIPKGCKEYSIAGVRVIAISEKSAEKKVAKILKNRKKDDSYISKIS